MRTVHGTAVAIDGVGVLLRGPSGSGKSDLALRLIDGGAVLVADDRTALTMRDGRVIAGAPETIRGRIEVRGIGVARVAAASAAPLALVVDLVAPETVVRLPALATVRLLEVAVPLLRLAAFETSTPAKIRLAVRLGADNIES